MERGTRAFFAIFPDENAAKILKRQIETLKRELPAGAPVSWVRPENLHLTLRFLDQVMPETLSELIAEAELFAPEKHPFSFRVGPARLFPNRKRPAVIAATLETPPELIELAARLERAAVRCGLRAETREFRPHLTFGRIRRGARLRLPEEIGEDSVDFLVNEFALVKSEPTREGPIYSTIQSFKLGVRRT